MKYYEQERECIDLFREEYEFLSNFYPAKMEFEGVSYHNSEAAYQAQKCKSPDDKLLFSDMYADEAKRFGRKVEVRTDWDEVKVDLMKNIVEAKFSQHPELAARLLETGDKPLKEGNSWGDIFWGIDHKTGAGENHLGRILMELREKYRKEGISELKKSYPVSTFGPISGITITDEDISQIDVECTVAAADQKLLGEPGQVQLVEGDRRNAAYVIHAAAPVYGRDDESLLEMCYRNTLNLAKEHGIHSIVFPPLSTGKFCFPKKKAIEIGIHSVLTWFDDHPEYEMEVLFSCVDHRIFGFACEYLKSTSGNHAD